MKPRPVKKWTEEEIQYLRDHYAPNTVAGICEHLGRSSKSISGKAFLLGLCEKDRSRCFSEKEKQLIIEKYSSIGAVGLAKLINRSADSIKFWAHRNGLKVSLEYRSETATRVNKTWERSAETRKKIGIGHRKQGSLLSNILRQKLWPTWNIPILARDNYQCVNCGSTEGIAVHHIRRFALIRDMVMSQHPEIPLDYIGGRYHMAELVVAEHKLDDGITLCRECHKIVHGKKPGELQGSLTAKGEVNLQPSQSNVLNFVDWKVQRLTVDDAQSNKTDTSARHAKTA